MWRSARGLGWGFLTLSATTFMVGVASMWIGVGIRYCGVIGRGEIEFGGSDWDPDGGSNLEWFDASQHPWRERLRHAFSVPRSELTPLATSHGVTYYSSFIIVPLWLPVLLFMACGLVLRRMPERNQ